MMARRTLFVALLASALAASPASADPPLGSWCESSAMTLCLSIYAMDYVWEAGNLNMDWDVEVFGTSVNEGFLIEMHTDVETSFSIDYAMPTVGGTGAGRYTAREATAMEEPLRAPVATDIFALVFYPGFEVAPACAPSHSAFDAGGTTCYDPVQVPEPGVILLLITGLGLMALTRRRRLAA